MLNVEFLKIREQPENLENQFNYKFTVYFNIYGPVNKKYYSFSNINIIISMFIKYFSNVISSVSILLHFNKFFIIIQQLALVYISSFPWLYIFINDTVPHIFYIFLYICIIPTYITITVNFRTHLKYRHIFETFSIYSQFP